MRGVFCYGTDSLLDLSVDWPIAGLFERSRLNVFITFKKKQLLIPLGIFCLPAAH